VVAYYLVFGVATAACLLAGIAATADSPTAGSEGVANEVWARALDAVGNVPAVFLLPLAVVAVGIVVLRRTVQPLARIERQLRQAATMSSVSAEALQTVAGTSPAETGWNRLVESLRDGNGQSSLAERLGKTLDGYRQKKSDQILNSLADGTAVTDNEARVTFANHALVSLLGLGAEETALQDKTMADCLDLKEAGGPASQLLDAKFLKRTVVAEIERTEDASQCVLRVARSPLHGTSSETAGGFVWTVRDVTQQKLADQMRDQFINAATHELRTPLANIKAYAETLVFGEVVDIEQQKLFANTIDEEATRLARFVDDLLHVSQMEAGSSVLRLQVTDMQRLFEAVAQKVRPQMEQKSIGFEMKLPGKLPELSADKDQLTVSLVNLLGNAVKYTPEGGRVQLHVELTDDEMHIHVEDTGIGIAEEELPKVFAKFFRSGDPRVREEVGSGLGLSLTNEIIRLHGGKLTVQSELNKGSKFTAILPTASE